MATWGICFITELLVSATSGFSHCVHHCDFFFHVCFMQRVKFYSEEGKFCILLPFWKVGSFGLFLSTF